MRRSLAFLILLATVSPAMAQDAPAKKPRLTWEAHFAQANTAHDGHLTLEEAKSGFKTVARHYRDIDIDGKGYVTENDVRAWRAMPKPARHAKEPDDLLRPRPAFQNAGPQQRTMLKASTRALVMAPEPGRR